MSALGFRDLAWMAGIARRRSPIAPSGSLVLWRPSQLSLGVNDDVTGLANVGSLGAAADLAPIAAAPKFDIVDGIKCVRYSDGGNNTALRSPFFFAQTIPEATALYVFRVSNVAVGVQYIGEAVVGGGRFGAAWRDGFPPFGFRGKILYAPGGVAAPNVWHYLITYANGAASRVDIDGAPGGVGDIGAGTTIDRYQLGAASTGAGDRLIGYIADVGIWPGDRRSDVNAYARAVLGLAP